MQHPEHLLVGYYDHELNARRRRQVEEHLAVCPACRGELERLRRLSILLSGSAVPDAFSPADRFRAQVMLRLPRRKTAPAPKMPWGWLAVPVGLVAVLALLQVLIAFSGVLGWAAGLAGWAGADLSLPVGPLQTAIGSWGVLGSGVVSFTLGFLGIALTAFLYLATIVVFLPFVGWIAVLWRSATRADRPGGNN